MLSLCGFKPLGFREAYSTLTLIYPDHRLAAGSRGPAEWFHADVQALKGRGKGFTYGQHESDKRKTGRHHIHTRNRAHASHNHTNQNMRNDPRGQGRRRGTRIRHTARPGRTTTALGGVTTRGSSRIAVRTLCPHGFKPLLSLHDGFQPLHSCPVQAFSRPSIAAPSLLALSRALSVLSMA